MALSKLSRAALLAVFGFAETASAAGSTESTATHAMYRLLFERDATPGLVVPGGFSGNYLNLRHVDILEASPCHFWLQEEGLNEGGSRSIMWEINLAGVTAIEVEDVERSPQDPAVSKLYRIEVARNPAIRVTFDTDLAPTTETFCRMKACGGTRLSFLHDGKVGTSRAAASLLRQACPGRGRRLTPLAP